jgi:hypothetical protein
MADAAYYQRDPLRVASIELEGVRSVAFVPMLKEGEVIGLIVIHRREVRPFTDKQIELVVTFASQAVIAIENVRLFTELQEKNRALTQAHAQATEALEQQTATSEILRAISGSPTDLQPVFDAVVSSAVRLCDSLFSAVFLFDGHQIEMAAHHGFSAVESPVSVRTLRRCCATGFEGASMTWFVWLGWDARVVPHARTWRRVSSMQGDMWQTIL